MFPLVCLGCLRLRVSCPRTKTWKSQSMTMISWIVTTKSARQWLTWRTASCPDITPTVAFHRPTACRGIWLWGNAFKRWKCYSWNIHADRINLSTISHPLSSGINQWRDQLKPSEILENLARLKGLSKPRTEDNGTSLTFNGKEYTLAEFGNVLFTELDPTCLLMLPCNLICYKLYGKHFIPFDDLGYVYLNFQ